MENREIKPLKVLMVCLGNICRSPLAEGIFRYTAEKAGLHCVVDSAGTGGWHAGEPPHHLSQKVALKNQIDISRQRARQLRQEDFSEFDHIFFMDADNLRDGKRIAGPCWDAQKVSLLLDTLGDSPVREVPDPYFGGFEGYIEVFELIRQACHKIVEDLKQLAMAAE